MTNVLELERKRLEELDKVVLIEIIVALQTALQELQKTITEKAPKSSV